MKQFPPSWLRNLPWRWIAAIVSVAGFSALLIFNAWTRPHDSDIFWHIGMGRDFIEKGMNPFRDHYSFTFPNHPIILTPVPFQVFAYGLWKLLGENLGFAVLTGFLTLLPFLILSRKLFRERIQPVVYVFALAFAADALISRGFARPELIAPTALLAMRALCERAKRKGGGWAYLLPILLLWIWVNTHVTSIFGFVFVFAYLGGEAIDSILRRDFKSAFRAGLLLPAIAFGVGWLNPSWTHPVLFAWHTPKSWNSMIMEHAEVSFWARETTHYLYWILCLGVGLFFVKKRRYDEVLLLIPLVGASISLGKTFSILVFSTLLVFAREIDLIVKGDSTLLIRRSIRIPAMVLLCLSASIGIWVSIRERIETEAADGFRELSFPRALVKNYLSAHLEPSEIYAEHWVSGYLIYSLGDLVKIYIDGRTNILYPPEHMNRYIQSRIVPDILKSELKTWKSDRVLAYLNARGNEVDLFETAVLTGSYSIEYEEENFVLLKRGETRFQAATKLMVLPDCWKDTDTIRLIAEEKTAYSLLPVKSELGYFLAHTGRFLNSASRSDFLKKANWPSFSSDRVLRLISIIAYRMGENEAVIRIINAMRQRMTRDILLSASARIRLGRFSQADEILSYFIGDQENLDLVTRLQVEELTGSTRANFPIFRKAYRFLSDSERKEARESRVLSFEKIKTLCGA